MSIFEYLGLPEDVRVLLFSVGLILSLSFFFSGTDFGIIKIPEFRGNRKRTVLLAGVFVIAGCVLAGLPLIDASNDLNGESSPDSRRTSSEQASEDSTDPVLSRLAEVFSLPMIENGFGTSAEAHSIDVSLDNATLFVGVTGGLYSFDLVSQQGAFERIDAAEGNSVEQLMTIWDEGVLSLAASGKLDRIVNGQATRLASDHRVLNFAIAAEPKEAGVIIEGNDVRTLDLGSDQFRLHLGGMPWTEGINWFEKIAMPASGLLIAVARSDGEVFLFDREADAGPRRIVEAQGNGIADLQFSSDGRFLAMAFRNGRVIVWNVQSGETEQSWEQEGYIVSSIDFSPDASWIVVGGYGLDRIGRIGLIEVGEGLVESVSAGGPVRDVVFSINGNEIFAVGQEPPLRILKTTF